MLLTETLQGRKATSTQNMQGLPRWFFSRKEDQEFCAAKCRAQQRLETPRGQAIHRAGVKKSPTGKIRGITGVTENIVKRKEATQESLIGYARGA